MLTIPQFENSVLVTDNPVLAAQISALFTRPGRYFPILEGPRMLRDDADNELVRRHNAIVRTGARRVVIGGLPSSAANAIHADWKDSVMSDLYEDHSRTLRGRIKHPKGVLRWGFNNLGIGLYQARLDRMELLPDLDSSPLTTFIDAGTHLLVACESGNALAEVIASNIAFASGASFAVFPELPETDRESWLEDMYALGEGGDVTGGFNSLVDCARAHLGQIDFTRYKNILFVTAGFPWGIAAPEAPSTQMYRYPDFGRAVIDGLWASQQAGRSARTALLIDPQTVEGSEIPSIKQALLKNGTLTRVLRGAAATHVRINFLLDLLPHDIVVLSSHAGDAPGERITYEYMDSDGRHRRLVVDQVVGFSYDAPVDKVVVTEYNCFHSLDGIDWRDKAGKDALPVGTAINTWSAFKTSERNNSIVAREPIARVAGSMAIKLYDGIWLFASHSFDPQSAPLFINNSCWSWHQLSERTTFAGARGYLGSLFPIIDAEAQEVLKMIFGKYMGRELIQALWLTQRDIYGASGRRPYVMVGLPFISIRPNVTDSASHLKNAYLTGIAHWKKVATQSPTMRQTAERFLSFLIEDLQELQKKLKLGQR